MVFKRPAEYFNLAIEIEPDWAPPYAGLAEVWGLPEANELYFAIDRHSKDL